MKFKKNTSCTKTAIKEIPKQKLKSKKELKKISKQVNFSRKYYFLFIKNQNCHSDCIYDGVERSTCCTLQYFTINKIAYKCFTKILYLKD